MIYDFSEDVKNKKILITPLNWGLGHATRCIPIIRKALSLGAEVMIASDGAALNYLIKVFPALKTFELPSYNVTYKYNSMVLNGIFQFPNVLSAIRKESKLINQIVNQKSIDLVISDNRFGCHSSMTKNVFITHQLNILHPNLIFKSIVNFQNRRWLKNFDCIWVPDVLGSKLSGKLSDSNHISGEINFIGSQSIHHDLGIPTKYDLLFLLSGPEPQRTRFEGLLINLASQWSDKKICFVSGTNESGLKDKTLLKHITYYPTVYSDDLTTLLNQSKLVISRSGYSTIMDLFQLDKNCILIPTPGQTEQEYFAERFCALDNVRTCSQKDINVKLYNLIEELEQVV